VKVIGQVVTVVKVVISDVEAEEVVEGGGVFVPDEVGFEDIDGAEDVGGKLVFEDDGVTLLVDELLQANVLGTLPKIASSRALERMASMKILTLICDRWICE